MKMILIAIILFFVFPLLSSESREEKAYLLPTVAVGSKYIYNVYYDNQRNVTDTTLNLTPNIKAQTKPSNFYFSTELNGYYENFLKETVQNHFDFDFKGNIHINELERWSGFVSLKYKINSDPSPNEKYGRLQRNEMGGSAFTSIKGSPGNSFDLKATYNLEDITDPNLSGSIAKYYSNYYTEGMAQYNNAFLPETTWFLRGTIGTRQYTLRSFTSPSFTTLLDSAKPNSYFVLGETGIKGRLTDRSMVDLGIGWHYRTYSPATATFAEPVFYMRFIEQVTKRDQLAAGYNYIVRDSYWSNYLLDQEIYIGLARVMGDQILVMGRIAYGYRSHSIPVRRDDQRIASAFSVKYSLSSTMKLTCDVKVDLLSSDQYNGEPFAATNPNGTVVPFVDRPASYKSGSFGIGLVADF